MWHIKTVDDAADLATNMVANGQKWQHLLNMLLYDIFDDRDHAEQKTEIKG